MSMNVLYTAKSTAVGGRSGHVATDDGMLNLDIQMPPGLGGKGGTTNPEQLFASGYAACFGGALDYVAQQEGKKVPHNEISAEVSIGPVGDTGFELAVKLTATLKGLDQATAEDLVNKAHAACPYSKATRNNIPVELVVITE